MVKLSDKSMDDLKANSMDAMTDGRMDMTWAGHSDEMLGAKMVDSKVIRAVAPMAASMDIHSVAESEKYSDASVAALKAAE